MSHSWTEAELTKIGDAEELQISSYRRDGTARPYVTIWVVRTDNQLYVRSATEPTTRGSSEQRQVERAESEQEESSGTWRSSPPHRMPTRRSTPPITPSTTATARRSSAPSPAAPPHPTPFDLFR